MNQITLNKHSIPDDPLLPQGYPTDNDTSSQQMVKANYFDLDNETAGRSAADCGRLKPSKTSNGKITPAGSAHQGTPRRSNSAKISTAEMVTNEVPSQKMTSSQ